MATSSILRRNIFTNFHNSIDIVTELCGTFGNRIAVTKRAIVTKKHYTTSQLQAPEDLLHFPDPDASWRWDSDLKKYYFGYTLFQLSCYNSEVKTDIPLLLRFTSTKRHDSLRFLVAFHELEKHMPAVTAEKYLP